MHGRAMHTHMVVIDPEWRALTSIQRDILIALAVEGPAKSTEIPGRLGEETESMRTQTLKNLPKLRDKGLVQAEQVDGRTKRNSLTKDGLELVNCVVFGMGEI